MEKMEDMIVVGYVPLLYCDRSNPSKEELVDMMTKPVQTHVHGCAWFLDGTKFVPMFVIDRAAEVVEHMEIWAENKIDQWFNINWTREGDEYVVALVPDHDKSVERTRMNYQIRVGYPLPQDIKVNVIFKFLSFLGNMKEVDLGETTDFYVVDIKDVGEGSMNITRLTHGYCLGNFKVVRDTPITKDILAK